MCLVICYCVVIVVTTLKMAPWYKHFACVHGEALLHVLHVCARSTVSMVTNAVVAVALKVKPKLKEASTIYHRLPI